jgi:hypothetical protein
MSSVKTFRLALPCLMALLAPPAPANTLIELSHTFAACVGRLSAQMEFQWLLSDPEADRTEAHRGAMIDLLEAVTPAEAARQALHVRLVAKQAHARLLTRAHFNDDPQDATWAATRAETEIGYCLSMMLN